ncbi:MAG: hypothetical protein IAG13_09970 [Deltaproteobacteria bacterium]|nr:hypothetical protein [Nannocystaceae bacterium]
MTDAAERWAENPLLVLELPAEASRAEIERAGQKLLGMLELGLRAAALYPTPLGPRVRTAESVRAAMAELRDPDKRLVHELWIGAPAAIVTTDDEDESDDAGDAEPFDALTVLGWDARR